MQKQYTLFYSWQSDKDDARKAIGKAIDDAIKKLKANDNILVQKDEATRDEAGFVNIEDVVKQKIELCDVFVCDITPVTKLKSGKCLPNANVLFELGYACSALNNHCVIAVGMEGEWEAQNMPFDFNHHSLIAFDPQKDDLYDVIKDSIGYCQAHLNNDFPMYFSDRQIRRNLISKKYIPDTYVEVGKVKRKVRAFVSPAEFYPLFFERASRMNFDVMNKKLIFNANQSENVKHSKMFDKRGRYKLRIDQYNLKDKAFDQTYLEDTISRFCRKLKKEHEVLSSLGNAGYNCSAKMKWLASDAEYMLKRIFVLTSRAGQGKTNFLCDLAQNVLTKRNIPFVYLNAFELNADNISYDIAREIYYLSNISLDEAFNRISNYCRKQHRYFIVIIDGLNENGKQRSFATNLLRLLQAVLKYDYVKVIMTCRTTYYKQNYEKVLSMFGEFMVVEKLDRRSLMDDWSDAVLIDRYFSQFNIQAELTEPVSETFMKDKLLFRMFCEANQGRNCGVVSDIRREELFGKYYQALTKEIGDRISRETGSEVKQGDIQDVINVIVELFIQDTQSTFIPLSEVKARISPNAQHWFDRFVQESTLVMVDLKETGNGESIEHLSFTYDQFRDYRIAHYLIDHVLPKGEERFVQSYNSLVGEGSRFVEGLSQYMFIYSKNTENAKMNALLEKQNWYEDVFAAYIWDVSESHISDADLERVKKGIQEKPKIYVNRMILKGRWDTKEFPRLNITLLMEYLNTLTDKYVYLSKIWNTARKRFYGYEDGILEDNYYQQLLDIAEKYAKSPTLISEKPDVRYIFNIIEVFAEHGQKEAKSIMKHYNKMRQEEHHD